MAFIGYRMFGVINFNGEPIFTSINGRPHYYKYFGPVCNGANPFENPSKGFYAFKDKKDLALWNIVLPYAEVELFGNVVEHEIGYRASKLMFKHIWIRNKHAITPKQIQMLERRYQCDVNFDETERRY